MPVRVLSVSDPACSYSWSSEPRLRRLRVEYGAQLSWRYAMGGLAREYPAADRAPLAFHWLDVAAEHGMPIDARLWKDGPIGSTFPACMAVIAAAEQGEDSATFYLRALREGLMCFRRKLDTTEALVEEAAGVGLDVERFRVDLASNAIVEAFAADLELARRIPDDARERGGVIEGRDGVERLVFPSLRFAGDDGTQHWVFGNQPYECYREAALAAGASPSSTAVPTVMDALREFGHMATREVSEVCDLPGPRAAAELWRLAAEWRVRPVTAGTGHLWEPAQP